MLVNLLMHSVPGHGASCAAGSAMQGSATSFSPPTSSSPLATTATYN